MTDHDKWIGKVVDHLNKLIQLDYDASLTYRDALEHVDDPVVRFDLETFQVEHERHIMQLSGIIRDFGGTPIEVHRDLKGAVLEGLTKLRSRRGTLGALRAMRTNEKITNRNYDKVAEKNMPPLAAAVVVEHLEDERRHHAAISAHIVRLEGAADAEIERLANVREERDRPSVR